MEGKTSVNKTKEHILNVGKKLLIIENNLKERMIFHDQSKLIEPELSIFDIYTEKLKGSTYGSEEYNQFLKDMKPALDHHYKHNRHHPEHFTNGINGMNLIDLVEMFCDWIAATERHDNGDIYKSIKLNKSRFNMSEQLCDIFRNTSEDIFHKKMIIIKDIPGPNINIQGLKKKRENFILPSVITSSKIEDRIPNVIYAFTHKEHGYSYKTYEDHGHKEAKEIEKWWLNESGLGEIIEYVQINNQVACEEDVTIVFTDK